MLLNFKFKMISKAIVACCVLHNFVELSEGHPMGPDRYQKARAYDKTHGHGTVSMPPTLNADAHRANQPYDSSTMNPETDYDGGMRLLNDVTRFSHQLKRLERASVKRRYAAMMQARSEDQ